MNERDRIGADEPAGEADLLLLAHAFRMKTDFHLRRPDLDSVLTGVND